LMPANHALTFATVQKTWKPVGRRVKIAYTVPLADRRLMYPSGGGSQVFVVIFT